MSTLDLEYAIKRDIHNNPVVREIDQAARREFWQMVAAGALLVMVILFYAWQHFELLRHGYRIEQMQKQYRVEEEVNRHLRLEIETLRSPGRIERIATEKLHLAAPNSEEAVIIERVSAPPPPAKSVVATRDVAAARPE